MEAEREKIRDVTGSAPPECPWWSLARPEVQEVAHLHRQREHGMAFVPFGGPDRMPARLGAALALYDAAVSQAREHFDRLDAEKREREARGHGRRPPPPVRDRPLPPNTVRVAGPSGRSHG